jgi:hypothetical protein
MRDITLPTGEKVVEANHLIPRIQQTLAQM